MIADIQPYVCVFNECPLPEPYFESETEWRNHKALQHNIHYSCNSFGCSKSVNFCHRKDFEEHLLKVHAGTFSGPEIVKLADLSIQPSSIIFDNCPFCDYSATMNEGQNLDHTAQVQQMQRHILDHLLSLFLMALPERDDLPEASSSKSRLRVDERSFDSLDVDNLATDSDDHLDMDYFHEPIEMFVQSADDIDWSFLPPYAHSDSDTDSILNEFKSRLKVSSVLDPPLAIIPADDIEISPCEEFTGLLEAANAILDEFGFINAAVVAWDTDRKKIRAENEIRKQQRERDFEERINAIPNNQEFDHGSSIDLEASFKRDEVARTSQEDRADYRAFVEHVFDRVWRKLNYEVDLLTPMYAKAVQFVEDSLAGSNLFKAAENYVPVSSAMELLLCIYQKLAIRHKKLFEAVLERDRRLKKTETGPLYALGNRAQAKKLKERFKRAEKTDIANFFQQQDERASLLMDVLDANTLRCMNLNQGYMESLYRAANEAIKEIAFDNITQNMAIPADNVIKAQNIVQELSNISEQIWQIFHVADMLLNDADYEVSVAKGRLNNAQPEDFEGLRQAKAKEDQKLVNNLNHRLDLIRGDTRKTKEEIIMLLHLLGKGHKVMEPRDEIVGSGADNIDESQMANQNDELFEEDYSDKMDDVELAK